MARSLISLDDTDFTYPARANFAPSEAFAQWETWGSQQSGEFGWPYTNKGQDSWVDAAVSTGNLVFRTPSYRVDSGGMMRMTGYSALEKLNSNELDGNLVAVISDEVAPTGNRQLLFPATFQRDGSGIPEVGVVAVWGLGSGLPGHIRFNGPHSTSGGIQQLSWSKVAYMVREP